MFLMRGWLWSNAFISGSVILLMFAMTIANSWWFSRLIPEHPETAVLYALILNIPLFGVIGDAVDRYTRRRYKRYVDNYYRELEAFAFVLTPRISPKIERFKEFEKMQKLLREAALRSIEGKL